MGHFIAHLFHICLIRELAHERSVIIDSPSCHSKLELLCFLALNYDIYNKYLDSFFIYFCNSTVWGALLVEPFWLIHEQFNIHMIHFSFTAFISLSNPFIMRFVFRLSVVWWGGGPEHVQWGWEACREDGQRPWYPQVYWWVCA